MILGFLFGRAVDLPVAPALADKGRAVAGLSLTLAVPLVPVVWIAMTAGPAAPFAVRACRAKARFDAVALGLSLLMLMALVVVPFLPDAAWDHWLAVIALILVWLLLIFAVVTWWSIVSIVALRAVERGKDFRYPLSG